jgi:hypothetical protein
MTRTVKLQIVLVLLLQVGFFSFIALHRFVDGDEGFYLLASRLVLMHKKPYLDFLFEQAPLLPYVYGLWLKCFGLSWISAKFFSALLTALLGTLLYEDACRQTQNCVAGLSAVIMFATSTLIFGFFPVVKPYSLAGLLLFAAYVVVSRIGTTSRGWLLGAGGLLFGFSVETRSYLVLLTPVFILWILRNVCVATRWRAIRWFLGGMLVSNLPALCLFFCSPDKFLFSNIGFHAIRSDGGLIGMWEQKLVVLLVTFLGGWESNGIQTSILFFISLGLLFTIREQKQHEQKHRPRLAFQIAVVLGIISLLPTPVHPQYFCLCIPFLLLSTVCALSEFIADLESRRAKLFAAASCAGLLVIYLGASINDFRRYLVTGTGVPGVELSVESTDWKLQRIIEVSGAINEVVRPGESVASFWPGYIFQTKANPFPGFEADYGLLVAGKITAEQRARYHVLSASDIEADFAAHRPRIVVLRNQIPLQGGKLLRTLLETENALRRSLPAHQYSVIRSVGGVSIYVYSPNQ